MLTSLDYAEFDNWLREIAYGTPEQEGKYQMISQLIGGPLHHNDSIKYYVSLKGDFVSIGVMQKYIHRIFGHKLEFLRDSNQLRIRFYYEHKDKNKYKPGCHMYSDDYTIEEAMQFIGNNLKEIIDDTLNNINNIKPKLFLS